VPRPQQAIKVDEVGDLPDLGARALVAIDHARAVIGVIRSPVEACQRLHAEVRLGQRLEPVVTRDRGVGERRARHDLGQPRLGNQVLAQRSAWQPEIEEGEVLVAVRVLADRELVHLPAA